MIIRCNLNKISEGIFFKGKIFLNEKLLSNDDIIFLLGKIKTEQELSDLMASFSGFFYLGVELAESIVLITDIVRTYPIFYKVTDNTIYVSENAFDLQENEALSTHDVDGFLACGYVIGNKTIFQNIFQVETANLLSISKINSSIASFQYYNIAFSPSHFTTMPKENLLLNLNDTYVSVLRKLINYANGRTIVVSLSAGYDSRLIVMFLKRMGVENVVCYTYGASNNYDINHWEVAISKQVAETLGYKWLYVPYSFSKWTKLSYSPAAEDYIRYVSIGTSMMDIQDWLAVYELKNKNLIPEDSIFVSGHSGDFIAGSHIPLDIKFDKTYTWADTLKFNRDKHFGQFPLSKSKKTKLCKSFFSPTSSTSAIDCINDLETFNWKERQSKHICNTARLYEFYGYDWYFPLWDREIVSFWRSIHPQERQGRKLYFEFVKHYCNSQIPYNKPNRNLFARVVSRVCKIFGVAFFVDNYYGQYATSKLSLFFKKNVIANELQNSFVLKNSTRKLRKISINGLGSMRVLTYFLKAKNDSNNYS